MRVVQSAPAMFAQLQGEDLVIRPMPAAGLLMPGATDAVVTPDGVMIVDGAEHPLYFVTPSGMVIGRTEHIFRDQAAASAEMQKQQRAAAGSESAAPA